MQTLLHIRAPESTTHEAHTCATAYPNRYYHTLFVQILECAISFPASSADEHSIHVENKYPDTIDIATILQKVIFADGIGTASGGGQNIAPGIAALLNHPNVVAILYTISVALGKLFKVFSTYCQA